MTYQYKIESERIWREKKARQAISNWKTCPISELNAAAKIFDSAIFYLIARFGFTYSRQSD